MNRGGPINELKVVDIPAGNITGDSTITANSIVLLNGTVNGASFYQRVGQRINMKSLQLEGFWAPNAGTTVSGISHYYRILIVYDAQCNGNFPTLSDLFNMVPAAGGGGTSATDSFINMNNRDRFIILRDKKYAILRTSTVTAGTTHFEGVSHDSVNVLTPMPSRFKCYIKLKGLETVYKAINDATVAGIQTGALYFIVLYNNGTGVAPLIFDYNARLRFYD